MCHLDKWGRPLKNYNFDENLKEEKTAVRSDRFISLSKPRSVERAGEYDQKIEFNLEDDGVYDVETLNPHETRQYKNLEAYPYVFETDFDVLSWATAMMTESPLGNALLKKAQEGGWNIALNDLDTSGFHLDVQEKIIELDSFNMDAASLGRSAFYRNSLILILAKALRDIWHEDIGGAFEENYKIGRAHV